MNLLVFIPIGRSLESVKGDYEVIERPTRPWQPALLRPKGAVGFPVEFIVIPEHSNMPESRNSAIERIKFCLERRLIDTKNAEIGDLVFKRGFCAAIVKLMEPDGLCYESAVVLPEGSDKILFVPFVYADGLFD